MNSLKRLYPGGYGQQPPVMLSTPSMPEQEPRSCRSRAPPIQRPQAAAKYMPTDSGNLPAKRPGYYKREHEGINPEAIMQLQKMDSTSNNEIKRKEKAIRLCMSHMMNQSNETFAEMMDRFEYKNKGRGFDLYLKPEHRHNFKGCNVKIGLLEIQNYMTESTAKNMRAEHLDPRELLIFKSVEDWYNTLEFFCAHPDAKF